MLEVLVVFKYYFLVRCRTNIINLAYGITIFTVVERLLNHPQNFCLYGTQSFGSESSPHAAIGIIICGQIIVRKFPK